MTRFNPKAPYFIEGEWLRCRRAKIVRHIAEVQSLDHATLLQAQATLAASRRLLAEADRCLAHLSPPPAARAIVTSDLV